MLRVIQIIDSLSVGGAEVLAVNIANELSEKNIESHICVTRKEGPLKKSISGRVGYLFLKRKRAFDLNAFFILRKYIKENRIDIIHAHSTSFFIATCVKLMYPKVSIVWHDHFGKSEFLEQRKSKVLKLSSNFFKVIIAVNSDLKNWAIKNLNTSNVLFLKNFPLFINKEKITNLKGVKGKRIVHLAGYRPQKDHFNLLNAFSLFLKDNPDWTLHLIGKNYQDDYGIEISNFLNNDELKGSVFEYGVCSDVEYILSQSDIGVLSSKSEGLPVSLLEYGLARLPVLVTNVGECSKVVLNKNGLVSPNNSKEFARKLNSISNNLEMRKELSNDLNNEVVHSFSSKVVINKLIEIYKENC